MALLGLGLLAVGPLISASVRAAVTGGLGVHTTLQSLAGSHREQARDRDLHRRSYPDGETRFYGGYGGGLLSDQRDLFQGDTLFLGQLRAGAASSVWDGGVTVPYYALAREGARDTSGPGPVRLHTGYELVPQYEQRPALYGALVGSVPTEEEGSALQTGEPAAGALFELSRSWPRYRGAVVAGLLRMGDPSNTDYDPVFFYGVRASEQRAKGRIYGSLEWRTPFRSGVKEATELHVGATYRLAPDRVLTGEAFLGTVADTPRIGIEIGVLRWL
jgi:hypothetical protein